MLKTTFLAITLGTLLLFAAPFGSSYEDIKASEHIADISSDKQNDANNRVKEALRPLLELKAAVEKDIPQRELNTIKRIAFQVFLVARKYL